MFNTKHMKSDWKNLNLDDTGSYTVFGVFNKRDNLELAMDKLQFQGFTEQDISVIIPEKIDVESKWIRNKEGAILVSIHCIDSDMMNNAKKLLEVSGAYEIASTSEQI